MEPQRKRKTSPGLVTNPFIKKRNLEWRISPPPLCNPERRRAQEGREDRERLEENLGTRVEGTSTEDTSPVPTQPISPPSTTTTTKKSLSHPSTSALIESAQLQIDNHLTYFTTLLTTCTLHPYPPSTPRLPLAAYHALYARAHGRLTGAHFVVTQHDHPVAGPHYDLRLQINASSSCSWAVMYGLPGDPNSRGKTGTRTGSGVLRNATETRVHCLWNHLVETAGRATGSLLVWDTGVYEVLAPRGRERGRGWGRRRALSSSSSSSSDSASEAAGSRAGGEGGWAGLTQQEKLARAFASRKIRLKLHGTRLPRDYVLNLRLTQDEDAAGRAKAAASAGKKPRRRRRGAAKPRPKATGPDTSDSDDARGEKGVEAGAEAEEEEVSEKYNDGATGRSAPGLSEMEKELRELEDEEVRRTNAYVGAVNTIGSVHQRKWFLSLDREACGFARGRRDGGVWWERKDEGEEAVEMDENRYKWPFYVRGPEYERSVVTGRLGGDVLKDEGVVGYVGRKGWRPILG